LRRLLKSSREERRNLVKKDFLSHIEPFLSAHGGFTATDEKLKNKKTKNQMNTSKALIAGAAVAGLMAGSLPVRAYAANTSMQPGVSLQTMAEKGVHACKGQNACKGQGGCKTGDQGCKGKNTCKGKGGCATDGSKPK
jgi:hypothetical protein